MWYELCLYMVYRLSVHYVDMAIQCIYMSVHGSYRFVLFYTMNMQNLALQ